MNRSFPLLTLATLLLGSVASHAQFINIDVSYKVILNPSDGTRPPGATDRAISNAVDRMNELQATYSRGYRFRLADPTTEVGGAGDTVVSRWYNTDFFQDPAAKGTMEFQARVFAQYAWNHNAINIYVNAGNPGGVCSFPGGEIIIIGSGGAANGPHHLHEIGHYFNLCHTQGCPCGDCSDCDSSEDDEISDTIADRACWDRDDIAQHTFLLPYAFLSPNNQRAVDNVYHNVMSYHTATTNLTEKQLDRWTEAANGPRDHVVSGHTWFVESGSLLWVGNSTNPFPFISMAVAVADPGDIVLIRPGTYSAMTINKPVTLRATRQGPVTIGAVP